MSNMKLEIGMFIRTDNGISKIEVDLTDGFYLLSNDILYSYDGKTSYCSEKDIKKASFNLIDLIEVGDYVNGRKVTNVWKKELVLYAGSETTYTIKNEDIEEILTHEQYEENCYKVVK